jgi:hypothetical protein
MKRCRKCGCYRQNPLDARGIICDFCAKPGVIQLHTCNPFPMGNRLRSQFMSCEPCSQFIANRNLRALVTQGANMLPASVPRREARMIFRNLYSQFFANLLDTREIEPWHIFDLQMLRARSRDIKCELRNRHPHL